MYITRRENVGNFHSAIRRWSETADVFDRTLENAQFVVARHLRRELGRGRGGTAAADRVLLLLVLGGRRGERHGHDRRRRALKNAFSCEAVRYR